MSWSTVHACPDPADSPTGAGWFATYLSHTYPPVPTRIEAAAEGIYVQAADHIMRFDADSGAPDAAFGLGGFIPIEAAADLVHFRRTPQGPVTIVSQPDGPPRLVRHAVSDGSEVASVTVEALNASPRTFGVSEVHEGVLYLFGAPAQGGTELVVVAIDTATLVQLNVYSTGIPVPNQDIPPTGGFFVQASEGEIALLYNTGGASLSVGQARQVLLDDASGSVLLDMTTAEPIGYEHIYGFVASLAGQRWWLAGGLTNASRLREFGGGTVLTPDDITYGSTSPFVYTASSGDALYVLARASTDLRQLSRRRAPSFALDPTFGDEGVAFFPALLDGWNRPWPLFATGGELYISRRGPGSSGVGPECYGISRRSTETGELIP